MIQIKGKYSDAMIMCIGDENDGNVDRYAISQIKMICDTEAAKGSNIVVMPDVHPGKVGPIGLTMTVKDAIMPALLGIDIGCGMGMVKVGKVRKDFQKLDSIIKKNIPAGFDIRSNVHAKAQDFDLARLICAEHIRYDKAMLSIGTLGGGNHFIEIDCDSTGEGYLIVHTGSRHLGKEVAEYYMGEEVIIPVNMRDGVILGTGFGNREWNVSAPHGSGRIASREKILSSHTVSEFKSEMKGIYSTCIGKATLDEAPFAYREISYIQDAIAETADIMKILKPVYNYKGGNA